jgi:hypothetical protein
MCEYMRKLIHNFAGLLPRISLNHHFHKLLLVKRIAVTVLLESLEEESRERPPFGGAHETICGSGLKRGLIGLRECLARLLRVRIL